MENLLSNNQPSTQANVYRDRELKRLNLIAEKIENLAINLESISDEEILERTSNFKDRIQSGEKIHNMLPEAFALVSEVIHRKCGFKPHRVQLMGAISLFEGTGVEMKTGEGKTITAIFPAYLSALTGDPVHIMTSNDYLAKRDLETVKPVFNSLGISAGAIDGHLSREEKKLIYKSDVVYGTTSNFGFDFLRDNLVYKKGDKFTRGLGFAIIDEADSLLLDQARTPLVLSESENVSLKEEELFKLAAKFANTLKEEDVEIDENKNSAVLVESGIEKAEKFFGVNFDKLFNDYMYYINNAVTAKFTIENEVDYIVMADKVVLIDRNTARPLPTHRFAEGLHQAVEAKENLTINPESKVLGQITIQNFLRKYKRISGMSGTIKTSEEELRAIYGLDVVQIPTNKPVMRKDDTKFYCYAWEKYEAIIKDVLQTHQTGQPVLIGTISIEESEMIKSLLDKIGIKTRILNAKNLSEEAKIVANAGRLNAVTIATDMAGRGTDIKLGGNAEVLADMAARSGLNMTYDEIKKETKANRAKVIELGGLKVIGSSLHKLVRVDGQLRGRSGRQGEVGESVFYTSLDDNLYDDMPEVKEVLRKDFMNYLAKPNERVKEKILQKIEKIQAINESIDFESRKNMITYDKEPSKQYDEFYKLRNRVLENEDVNEIITSGVESLSQAIIDCAIDASNDPEFRDERYAQYKAIFDKFNLGNADFNNIKRSNREEQIKRLSTKILVNINKSMVGENAKNTLLKTMDDAFISHLKNIEMLKRQLSISSIGDQNPTLTYEQKAHTMYNEMIDGILPEVVMEIIEKTPKPMQFGRFNVPKQFTNNSQLGNNSQFSNN